MGEQLPQRLTFPILEAGQEVVRPDVVSMVTQLAQLAQLARIRKLEESKIPTGIKPLKRTVTNETVEIGLSPPWISFSLVNDGASAISVWVNTEGEPSDLDTIASGESYSLNMGYPVIQKLFLKSVSGGSATVRIYGKEGKKA